MAFHRQQKGRVNSSSGELPGEAETGAVSLGGPIPLPELDLRTAVRNIALMVVLTLTTAWLIHLLFGGVMLMTALSLAVAYAVVVGGPRVGLACALVVFALVMAQRFGPEELATLGGAQGQALLLEVLACLVVLLLAVAVELRRQVVARLRDAVAARQRQATFMQALLDGLGPQMFVSVLRPDGTILEVNRSLAEAFGVTREQLIGQRVDAPGWMDGPAMQAQLGEAVAAAARGDQVRADLRVRTQHGLRWVDCNIGPLFDRDGGLRYLIASALDITERRASEKAQRAMFDTVPTALLLVDREGRIAMANPQASSLLGYANDQLAGSRIDRLVPEDARARHPRLLESYFAHPTARVMGGGRDLVAVRADGATVPVEIGLNPLPVEHGEYVIAAISDISDRRAAQAALEAWAGRLEAEVAERTEALRAVSGRWQRRSAQLQALGRMLDRMPACTEESQLAEVVAAHAPEVFAQSSGVLCLERDGQYRLCAQWGERAGELQPPEMSDAAARRAGVQRWRADCGMLGFRVPISSGEEHLGSLLCLLPPSSEAAEMEDDNAETAFLLTRIANNLGMAITSVRLRRSLESQATRDALTQLYNRRYLDTEGARLVAAARRAGQPLAVLAADIDYFKRVNDSFGHDTGDRVLRGIAAIVREQVREMDLPCRYGGEEFVVLLPDADRDAAEACAERIRSAIAEAQLADLNEPVTVSLGVAILPEHGTVLRELIAAADEAMYCAKRAGRNRVAVAGASAA